MNESLAFRNKNNNFILNVGFKWLIKVFTDLKNANIVFVRCKKDWEIGKRGILPTLPLLTTNTTLPLSLHGLGTVIGDIKSTVLYIIRENYLTISSSTSYPISFDTTVSYFDNVD
jgi:hypothetical protein